MDKRLNIFKIIFNSQFVPSSISIVPWSVCNLQKTSKDCSKPSNSPKKRFEPTNERSAFQKPAFSLDHWTCSVKILVSHTLNVPRIYTGNHEEGAS